MHRWVWDLRPTPPAARAGGQGEAVVAEDLAVEDQLCYQEIYW